MPAGQTIERLPSLGAPRSDAAGTEPPVRIDHEVARDAAAAADEVRAERCAARCARRAREPALHDGTAASARRI